jgi:F0F1-type ATP synthase assembly protein I
VEGGAFVVVEDVVPTDQPTRIWRLPVVLLGLVLVVVGVLALVPVMFVVGATVLLVRLEGELELGDAETWLWVVGLSIAGYIVLRVGLRMLRGRRQSALFLRRFGFTDATRVLSGAVTRGLGRRWRLITLDDLQVLPVGVGGPGRRLVRFGPWVLGAAVIAFLVWVVPPWFDAQFDSAVSEAVDEAAESAEDPISAIFGVAIAALVVGVVVGTILLFVTLAPIALAAALTLFGFGAGYAIRRAEGRRAVHIQKAGQVEKVVRRVERATSRIYSPRLTVVRCAHDVWQAVVRRFADLTDVTLIDVSDVSTGLLWELTELGPELSASWVLVGRRDRLDALLVDPSPNALQLRTLLDGQTVLAYRLEGTKRFEEALKARLAPVG